MKTTAFLLIAAALIWAAAMASPAGAQPTRITALPASDVFSIRVVGDTIAAGMDTAVFVSTNAGVTWHMSTRPSRDAKLIDAIEIRNRRLYAGTFGTGVFVSDDLGATWQSFNEGLVGGFLDSQLDVSDLEARGDSLVASTFGAGVYARNLAGAGVWQPFGAVFEPNQASNVNDLALGGTRLLACAGANGTTFHRDPGDADWTLSLLGNTGLRPGVTAQTSLFTGSRWVVGTNAGVFLSASGEEPWTPSSTRLAGVAWSTFAHMGATLFAAFDSVNTILMAESHDTGTTWTIGQRVAGPFAYQLAVHGADLYIARSDGLFIQTQTAASVPVGPGKSPLRFSLAGAQPVRDVVRFRFDLPVAARTALEVFDVTGRRIADPVESFGSAGPHEVTISARTLPPGVYAARLTSGRGRESARFIRVR
jgi:hypothetical protein